MIDHGPLSITEYALLASIGGDSISGMDAPEIAATRPGWLGFMLRLNDRGLVAFVGKDWILTESGRAVKEGRPRNDA